MTTPTKAVLLDIRAYVADNNLRRSIASFSLNFASTSESQSVSSFLLNPNASKTLTNLSVNSAVTLVRTDQPVNLTVVSGVLSFQVLVNKVFLVDFDVDSLTIAAPGTNTEAAKVTILQG